MRLRFLAVVSLLVLPATCGLLIDAAPAPPVKPDKAGLKVAIAVPIHHGTRSIFLGEKAGSFYVVVTNTSNAPIKLWRDWCSWGYYNLFFEIDQDGKAMPIRKVERDWRKNFPDWQELKPGDPYVIPVSFDPAVWKLGELKGGAGKPREVRMRAVFQIEGDEDAQKAGIWTGRVESAWETYGLWSNG